jgi:hypothetical protein
MMSVAAAVGLSPLVVRYYSTSSTVERRLLRDIMIQAIEFADNNQQNLARRIINELASRMGKS